MANIAIFASGTGTNAKKIIEYFKENANIHVSLVVSNKETAPVLGLADEYGIEKMVIGRQSFYETEELLPALRERNITLIVLAGFLWLLPDYLVRAYDKRMINIHPALLPKYGGKGMYGMHVHRAVKAAGDRVSGITIHYVNEHYDEGGIVFQASCPLLPEDEPEDIARKVQELEHRHFAPVVEKLVRELEETTQQTNNQ
ncbi:MAG: phosphoribosylglycinamide formyltransferase [Lewinellaceae bacterium]|nr:phosphoribosylglycinamide formyltransferase [Phaeodactylibacter sp.]MCB9348561.1 phosphoribosylglycinamide formyltransferase [Lewinellaceae bacterium]